jgi:hypothetical protein
MRRRSELDQDRGDLDLPDPADRLSDGLCHRAPVAAARNVAMMLVVLPSWTSFLIRVYAWKASWTATACSTSA